MKLVMQVYFLLYVLSGGFRHALFESEFFHFLNGQEPPVWLVYWMLGLQLVAIAYLLLSRSELLLVFYVMTFLSDIYVQNFIKFESSVILMHQLPLISFLYLYPLKAKWTEPTLRYILLLMISVGYVSSGIAKLSTGWLNGSELVLNNHLRTMQLHYGLPVLVSINFLSVLPFFIWKMLDVLIVVFQLSFFSFFFSLRFLKVRFFALIVFHWAISIVMGIHIFFPFLLIYVLLFIPWKETNHQTKINWFFRIFGIVFFIFFLIHPMDTDFVMKQLPFWFYLYYDFFLTGIIGLFLFITLICTKNPVQLNNQ